MKILDTQRLVVCEDSEYKLSLQCETLPQCEKLIPRQLYLVTLADSSVYYVLSEDAQTAISQATCGSIGSNRTWSEEKSLEENATAIRLPFRIRGWGGHSF